jgi:hypothetical protein
VFVLLPAAAYDGNRFPCRPYGYPPLVHEPGDLGPDAPVLVTDVPRLNDEDGQPSRIQLLTGDLTTPAICFHNPRTGQAAILLTDQGGALGNHGVSVEESPDRGCAVLRLESPGVRRDTLYTMCSTATPSWDRGADWAPGTETSIRFRLFRSPAADVQALYDRFAEVRKDLSGPVRLEHGLLRQFPRQIVRKADKSGSTEGFWGKSLRGCHHCNHQTPSSVSWRVAASAQPRFAAGEAGDG